MGMSPQLSQVEWGCHLHSLKWDGDGTSTFWRIWECRLNLLKKNGDVTCIILVNMGMSFTLSLKMWDATSILFRIGNLYCFRVVACHPPHCAVR